MGKRPVSYMNIVKVIEALKEKKRMTLAEVMKIMGYDEKVSVSYVLTDSLPRAMLKYSQLYGEDAVRCVKVYRELPSRKAPKTPDRIFFEWVCNEKQS